MNETSEDGRELSLAGCVVAIFALLGIFLSGIVVAIGLALLLAGCGKTFPEFQVCSNGTIAIPPATCPTPAPEGPTGPTGPTGPVDPPKPELCSIPLGQPWIKADPRPEPRYNEQINRALMEVTGCTIGSDCVVADTPAEFFMRVNRRLQAQGLCAGLHEADSDEIAVGKGSPHGPNQGYHVYNYGGGKVVWAEGAYRDTWALMGGPDPSEPEPPKPEEPPLFPKKPVTNITLKKVGTARLVYDATARTGPDREFCKSIGKNQDRCPLGPECCAPEEECALTEAPDFQCKEKRALREKYEREAGPWRWYINGILCWSSDEAEPHTGWCFPAADPPNPFQVVVKPEYLGKTLSLRAGNLVEAEIVVQ